MLIATTSSAQTAKLFLGDEKLGSSQVNSLLQDAQGYVWVATSRGLTRYDGHRFETFQHTETEGSLTSNYVECLAEDGEGRLLVGTTVSLCSFSPATRQFTKVRLMEGEHERETCHVQAIIKRCDGTVLVATSGTGLYEIRESTSQAHHATKLLRPETSDVKAMAEARDGTLWMAGSTQGVVRVAKDNKIRTYTLDGYPVIDVCIDRRGYIYACGHTGGVYRYDSARDAFTSITGSKSLAANRLAASGDGQLLIATDGRGLISLNASQHLSPCTILQHEIESEKEKITAIMEDCDGNLWLGIDQKGLLMQPRNSSLFEYIGPRSATHNLIGNRRVSAIHHGRDGTLWVGTGGNGLYTLSPDGQSQHYDNVPADVLSICEDKDGNIFLASWLNGCGRLNRQTGNYEQLACTRKGNAIHVMSILTDRDNHLWIATCGDGLKCLDLNTMKLNEYRAKDGHNETDNVLSNNFLGGLSLSADGHRLYFAMSTGMGCIDLQSRSFASFSGKNILLSQTAVHTVREDSNGNIWAVTPEGMYLIDLETGVKRHLTTADGLPTNEIASLEIADDGTLWVSTLHGLCHYEPSAKRCTNYFRPDGLQSNEFGNTVSARLADGRLAFGGTGGLTLFKPSNIQPPTTKRQVRLTGLSVGGEPVTTQTRSGWYQVCDTTVSLSTTFHLAHNYNSMTLSFSTMDFSHADGMHYEYAIGHDSTWQRLPASVSELTLSHLTPGTYKMRVRAMSGSNASDELRFTIEVHPAWYASVYAKIAYTILAILLLLLYLHRRQHAEWQRLRVQEHIHAAQMKEMEESATGKKADLPNNMAKKGENIPEEAKRQTEVERTVEELIEKPSIQTPNNRLLERVLKVINAHITDPNLSVEQIANEAGISRAHLHRKMKEMTGESTSNFVRNVRMKRAAYLLESSHLPIAEVMYACGYDSPANFSRAFKLFYGMPPTEYIRCLTKS